MNGKKKKCLSVFLTLAFVLSGLLPLGTTALAADATVSGSWGDSADTRWYDDNATGTDFTITTAAQLAGLAQLVKSGDAANGNTTVTFENKTITLGADIDLSAHEWVQIGWHQTAADPHAFRGTFDGQSHTISGLTIGSKDSPNTDSHAGLFGYSNNATIKDTVLTGVSVYSAKGNGYVGGLVGEIASGKINACSASGYVQTSGEYARAGGLVGNSSTGDAVVTNCYSSVNVTTTGNDSWAGSLMGMNGGKITYCCATGNITAVGDGGVLVGQSSGSIEDCYSAVGTVSAKAIAPENDTDAGGLVGNNNGGSIIDCYSIAGTIKAEGITDTTAKAGGLAGDSWGPITTSFAACGTVTVTAPADGRKRIGGFVGNNDVDGGGTETNCYFDETATGQGSDGRHGSAVCVEDSSLLKGKKAKETLAGFAFSSNWEVTSVDSCGTDWYPYLLGFSGFSPNFNSNGGSQVSGGVSYYTDVYNGVNIPLRPGYTFTGWYTDSALTQRIEVPDYIHFFPGETLYAGWTVTPGTWKIRAVTDWYHPGDSSFNLNTAAQLAGLADLVNSGNDFSGKTINLDADIDLSACLWVPIGWKNGYNENSEFKGTFNGKSHTISGLNIGSSASPDSVYDEVGLFGELEGAAVENTRLTGVLIYSYALQVGGLAGTCSSCTIDDCSVSGTMVSTAPSNSEACIGGLAGECDARGANMTIHNCETSGSVSTATCQEADIGGLVGCQDGENHYSATIDACSSVAAVTANTDCCLGGLVGIVEDSTVQNCSAGGDVNSGLAADSFGGIAGGLVGSVEDGTVQNCSAGGDVNSGLGANSFGGTAGGLVGDNDGILKYCYAYGNVICGNGNNHNDSYAGGFVGKNSRNNDESINVTQSYACGNVKGGTKSRIGGFVGDNGSGITDCYSALGTVTGSDSAVTGIGGFAGCNYEEDSGDVNFGYISGSFSANGAVTVTDESNCNIGGFVGDNGYGRDTGCYFDTVTTGQEKDNHGTDSATAEIDSSLKGDTAKGTLSGFDFTTAPVWVAEADRFPHLKALEQTLSFNSAGGSLVSPITFFPGSVLATPEVPTLAGYTFSGWYTPETQAFDFSQPAMQSVTLTAHWTAVSYVGGETTQNYEATVSGTGSTGTLLPVAVDTKTGNANVDVSVIPKSAFSGQGTSTITVPAISGVNSYSLGIPTDYLSVSGRKDTLTVNTASGSLSIPSGMLAGTSSANGKQAKIFIGQGDKSGLTGAEKTAIGNRPLIQLAMTIDGQQTEWSNPNAPVTVSIPYTPTAEELKNPEAIVIWYIDGSGNAVSIPNGHYNAATGKVTFAATHFSQYAVGFNKVGFSDVAGSVWYAKAVAFAAARNITSGTGSGSFSPDANLTRGQFLVMLMKAYGISPDTDSKDNFYDAGSTWYTGYLASAKRQNLTTGIGNNLFAPDQNITRQEMFTMLYNALKECGNLPSGTVGQSLSDFTDAGDIAAWAKDAMTLLAQSGTITGSEGKLQPTATATRAEMAQLLYQLLSK